MTSGNTVLADTATSKSVTAASGDGSYYFHIAPYGTNGDIGATAHFGPIKIDTTAPSALSVSPDGGSYSATQSVSLSATDANNYTIYYTTDGTTPTSSSVYSTAITVASTKTIKAIAIDSAGNSSSVKSSAFTINTTTNVAQFGSEVTAGSIIATDLSANTTAKQSISIEGSAVTHYKYKVDTGSYGAQTLKATPIDITTLADGSHTLYIVGYDGSTWQADGSATELTFTVDNTAPSAISFSTASGTELTADTTITISSLNSNSIYYTTDGSTPSKTNGTNSATKSLTISDNGTVTIKAIAYDTAGNKTSVSQAIYTVNIAAAATGGGTTTGGTTPPPTTDPVDEVIDEVVDDETIVDDGTDVVDDIVDDGTDTTPDDGTATDGTTPDDDTTGTTPDTGTGTIDTGLTIGETITEQNEDGSETKSTVFTNNEGESTEVKVTTKIASAATVVNGDGSTTTSVSVTNISGLEVQSEIKLNPNGTIQNKVIVGENSSLIDVEFLGAETTMNDDESVETKAEKIQTDGSTTQATVTAKIDGTTQNILKVIQTDGTEVEVDIESEIEGSDTIVKADGSVETKAEKTQTDGSTIQATITAKVDGTVENIVGITNTDGITSQSKVSSQIPGTDATVSSVGETIVTTPEVTTPSGKTARAIVSTTTSGTLSPSFSVVTSDGEAQTITMPVFPKGSQAIAKKSATGSVVIEVVPAPDFTQLVF